ncbi:ABC transporter ATP-binding protein [Aquihabitans sp. McL0605]|uniref:ABC transporter ATP-binding protein n=1 Tax=Aquihabitans sp. McL0605 TaxID=3415671 RepID=UPI003CF9B877
MTGSFGPSGQGGAVTEASTDDVALIDVSKRFGSVSAVEHVNLTVRAGEFFSLLGPSGSGKTTCLRMIAGFEQPTEGRIVLRGTDVAGLPAYDRDVNTVFQDYALFPHLSVGENVEYGLKVKRVGKAERRSRAADALAMVRLDDFGSRRVTQLSGGQRQRVALARALVNRPRVLLLDEPLGALDLKLREEMQVELKRIQTEVGITFIFVTHDQDEALSMSDRIAVFANGHLEQVGTPSEVYERPASAFVAGFVGTSNVLDGTVANRLRGSEDAFSVRPEKITLIAADAPHDAAEGEIRATGTIRSSVYLGERTRVIVDLDGGGEVVVVEQNRAATGEGTAPGTPVRLAWDRRFDQVLPIAPRPTDPASDEVLTDAVLSAEPT